MKTSSKITLLIQARVGSTRLPKKMLLPFYKSKTIFEILLENLLKQFSKDQIILSTSTNPQDEALISIAQKYKIRYYQGAEHDVLDRFIQTSEKYNIEKLIRVCADNPFIQSTELLALSQRFVKSNAEYSSWFFDDGTPSIRTHSGFFAEAVTLKALKKVNELTQDPFFHEHVTNFIYGNEDIFEIERILLKDPFLRKVRLTIDTEKDFLIAKEVYAKLYPKVDIASIKETLIKDELFMNKMAENIRRNEK